MEVGARWRRDVVEASHFYTNKDIGRLIAETEGAVTQNLEGGDRQRAMKRLRVPPLNEQQSPWTTFRLGLFLGSFAVLFLAVIIAGRRSAGASLASLGGPASSTECPLPLPQPPAARAPRTGA